MGKLRGTRNGGRILPHSGFMKEYSGFEATCRVAPPGDQASSGVGQHELPDFRLNSQLFDHE